MKRIYILLAIFFVFFRTQAQEKPIKINNDSSDTHYLLCNIRLFDWSMGGELKYLHLKEFEKAAFSPVFSVGYENYLKDKILDNGIYQVSGSYVKLGIITYEKESKLTTYIGANAIFSFSNQNVKSTFHDPVWGDYSESPDVNDFALGAELNGGTLIKIYKNWHANFNLCFGTRIGNSNNPLRNPLHLDDAAANGFPYFSPGMGRGKQFYINAMAGLAYSF
jgi:hypothetical protein